MHFSMGDLPIKGISEQISVLHTNVPLSGPQGIKLSFHYANSTVLMYLMAARKSVYYPLGCMTATLMEISQEAEKGFHISSSR